MHLSIIYLGIISLLSSLAFADISISSPGEDKSYSGSDGTVNIEIKWVDSGVDPALEDLASLTILLCTGNNSDVNCFETLDEVTTTDITDGSYKASFADSICADGEFYFQLYAVTSDGGSTIHYTNRFTLTDMTGSQEASGSGDSPDPQTSISSADVAVDSKSFSVTYTLQTGKTRYAPMQQQPGSEITATTWSRRFPTSAVTYYSTIKASPVVYSTITPGWSYTMESAVNYASPAAYPSEVGWYAASEKIQSATLSDSAATSTSDSSKKRKRWDIE